MEKPAMKSTMQSPPDTAHFLLRSDGQVSTMAVIRFSIPANYNNTLVSHKPDIWWRHSLTWLSSPRVRSMKKKMTDQSWLTGK